jgi:chromosome segregation ATPase
MLQSILKDLDGRTERIKDFDNQIEQIDSTLSELREQLTEAEARQCIAQKAVDEIDDQIRQIDRRIAGIRGFD